MRSLPVVCRFSIVVAMLLLGGRAFAQGCNQGVVPVDYEHECNGVDVPESYCGGSGTAGYFCYMGYGECSADGYQFTEANIVPDTSCQTGGCCNGSISCSNIGYVLSLNYRKFLRLRASPIFIDNTVHRFHRTSRFFAAIR